MEEEIFIGDFHKKKHYIAFKECERAGRILPFDKDLYEQVSKEISEVLGKKKKYGIFEAMEYFQTKYLAYRIPWKYVMNYTESHAYRRAHLHNHFVSFGAACLAPDETAPFNFEVEDNITLVIDTFYNNTLRERYPSIIELETYFKERQEQIIASGSTAIVAFNTIPIVVIGTLDKHSINSMSCVTGECAIPDVNYEIWYFHEHS